MRFAIVDDDKVFRMTTEYFLKKHSEQLSVLNFENGKEALDYINVHSNSSQELPDVIFLDINMPIIDGWKFLEEYAKIKGSLPKNFKIYIVTSSLDNEDKRRAEKISDLTGFKVKPMKPSEEDEIIRQSLAA